jgi:hypothetical protein
VREVRIVVEQKGLRSKTLAIVTTLLDVTFYTKAARASLYRRRWSIELNFRHIKTPLGMELLRTKTPEMAKKEVLIYMLAYNLIRSWIGTAKQIYHIDIQRISFKGTVQHLSSLVPYLAIAGQPFKGAPSDVTGQVAAHRGNLTPGVISAVGYVSRRG